MKTDYVFANEKVWKMVIDVNVHFIDDFQHAAIDVNIKMSIQKGPAEELITPKKLSEIDSFRGHDGEEFTYWA